MWGVGSPRRTPGSSRAGKGTEEGQTFAVRGKGHDVAASFLNSGATGFNSGGFLDLPVCIVFVSFGFSSASCGWSLSPCFFTGFVAAPFCRWS